jgi:hydroxymethylbilane synthase
MRLIFATRSSSLARWQTRWVMEALQETHPDLQCEERLVTTRGDKIVDKPLPEIGGKGLFTEELEAALLRGSVDCAVHSLKDLPTEATPGLVIGCVPRRGEARDATVSARGYTLESLPNAAIVGTSSLRRTAQLLTLRPDVEVAPLRGNVDTRVHKALDGQYDAIILAGAGLIRLGLEQHAREWISLETMLPAPGQGALAVQCRADDKSTLELLAALEDGATRRSVTAERGFLTGLGGGCAVPVAGYAEGEHTVSMRGLVASPDGKQVIRVQGTGEHPNELGGRLAKEALANGAAEILAVEAVG